jgi:3-dehydroquinate dehydratase
MIITQTIDIPADRCITVPREVPTGKVILTFTPAESGKRPRMTEEEEIEHINRNADRLNAEALDVLSYQVPLWDDD